MIKEEQIDLLSKEMVDIQKILITIGDENRQFIILNMMRSGSCKGLRVDDIASKSHLSRPAVSHHLGILKEAGILSVRKEGTKNYYFFDSESNSFKRLDKTIHDVQLVLDELQKERNK